MTKATAHGAEERETVELVQSLIAIDSVNPDLVAGGAGEDQIARFAADWLSERGFDCVRVSATPGRPSVLGVARGSGGGRSIMLNGHLDTVALTTYDGDGLRPILRDGKLYGRGAYDMKSGIAAIMIAATRAAAVPHTGDIVVALVADEEYASTGTEQVLEQVVTDAAVVVEPSGLDLVTAHRGFVWAKVTVHGVAAHGSRPDLGVDAISKAGHFLVAVETLAAELANGPSHPLLHTGSVHASTITGGAEASSYPDRCTIVLERRTIPGETPQLVEGELRRILDNLTATVDQFGYNLEITAHREPFAADTDSAVADALARAVADATGQQPLRRGEPFWTDCALLHAAGIDTVLFGVDGGGAHAASEWVTLSSLHLVARALEATVRQITR